MTASSAPAAGLGSDAVVVEYDACFDYRPGSSQWLDSHNDGRPGAVVPEARVRAPRRVRHPTRMAAARSTLQAVRARLSNGPFQWRLLIPT